MIQSQEDVTVLGINAGFGIRLPGEFLFSEIESSERKPRLREPGTNPRKGFVGHGRFALIDRRRQSSSRRPQGASVRHPRPNPNGVVRRCRRTPQPSTVGDDHMCRGDGVSRKSDRHWITQTAVGEPPIDALALTRSDNDGPRLTAALK
jgi:hypothetical protein